MVYHWFHLQLWQSMHSGIITIIQHRPRLPMKDAINVILSLPLLLPIINILLHLRLCYPTTVSKPFNRESKKKKKKRLTP